VRFYFDIIEVIEFTDYEGKSTQDISDYVHKLIKDNLDNLPKY